MLWPWQDLATKQLLFKAGTASSARPLILNATRILHWAVFYMQFLILWILFSNINDLVDRFQQNFQVFFLLLWPVFTCIATTSVILMHMRERWQIAPISDSPDLGNDYKLKILSLRLFFSFMTFSNLSLFVGVFGMSIHYLIPFVFITLFAATLGPIKPLLNLQDGMDKEVPIAVPLGIGFVFSSFLRLIAFTVLIDFGLQSLPFALLISLLIISLTSFGGGFLEGVLAEKTFNQAWHMVAALVLLIGELLSLTSLALWV